MTFRKTAVSSIGCLPWHVVSHDITLIHLFLYLCRLFFMRG